MIPNNSKKGRDNNHQTICLNMIVKNESHIIENTLKKLLEKIKFDYWVISDTGSTDNTREIIQNFFDDRKIPGELFCDEWKDFGHNRSLALEHAYNKTDYLLIFDADDEILGDFKLPQKLTYDSYHFKFGSSEFTYTRTLLVNNHKIWKFKGVLHEYIAGENGVSQTILEGNYFVLSGRTSSRNQDPDKYKKDAEILSKAYEEAKNSGDELYRRYSFYCAQSYKDANRPLEASVWYKKCIECANWDQEKYYSCLKLMESYEKMGKKEESFFWLVESLKIDTERLECFYHLLVHYLNNDGCKIAYQYYCLVKDFYENKYLKNEVNLTHKLFIDLSIQDFLVPYYMIILADRLGDRQLGIKMYKMIFTKKYKMFNSWYLKNMFYNLRFFDKHILPEEKQEFSKLFVEYMNFLKTNNHSLEQYDFLSESTYSQFGFSLETEKITYKFSEDECKKSKNILIYTGYGSFEWNESISKNSGLGGSERAVIYLTKYFPKDYNIFICGTVKEEKNENISYITRETLTKMIDTDCFHTIIISRYVSFFELYKNISSYQNIIWAHDTHLIHYGCTYMEHQAIVKKWKSKITGCVCLTEWQASNYKQFYPELKDKIHIINNGIITELFNYDCNNKIPHSFIYSSCSERGLTHIIEVWPKILEIFPDATLNICSYNHFPHTQEEINIKKYMDTEPSVKHLGKLNANELYELMSKTEYWFYPTNWPETSCITALEMMASKVICLYYPFAGLTDTMNGNGVQINSTNEIEMLKAIDSNKDTKEILKNTGYKYVMECSWKNRAKVWCEKFFFLKKNEENEKDRQILDRLRFLRNNYSIPDSHKKCLYEMSTYFKPNVIYDIGANVLHWTDVAKKVWPDSKIILFDAIESGRKLYEEENLEHYIGVLSNEDDKIVKFYENELSPGGNSYYKEIGSKNAEKYYPENNYINKITKKLETLVKENNIALPDLIKIDVQGAELDILKGSMSIINKAKYLIIELQHTEYNRGAPLSHVTIKYLNEQGWEVVKEKFSDNGPDADYLFINKNYGNKIEETKQMEEIKKVEEECSEKQKKWILVIPFWYKQEAKCLSDYLTSLKSKYSQLICLYIKTNDIDYTEIPCLQEDIYEITFVQGVWNKNIYDYFLNKNDVTISILNLEPLTIPERLKDFLENQYGNKKFKFIYDYSKSNIKILNNNGYHNTKHLEYNIYETETLVLSKFYNLNDKKYDFGLISYDNPCSCERRRKIIDFLNLHGYKTKIICGWGEKRDLQLSKCKFILNIHGQFLNKPSDVFEHIRCDRLLGGGYNILSENSYELDTDFINKYPNLKIISYNDFFDIEKIRDIFYKTRLETNNFTNSLINISIENEKVIKVVDEIISKNIICYNDNDNDNDLIDFNIDYKYKNICFIHNYSEKNTRPENLIYFIEKISECGLIKILDKIIIKNTGEPIYGEFGSKFSVINHSDNEKISQTSTINLMHEFSLNSPDCNILYLNIDNNEKRLVDTFINKYQSYIDKLNNGFEVIKSDLFENIFSQNIWWIKSNYLKKLPKMLDNNEYKNDNTKIWLYKGQPIIF